MSKDRKKMVSCGAITSRKLARISYGAELVYWRIYMASDNRGSMSGDTWDVWQSALPGKVDTSEASIVEHVAELVRAGLIEQWQVDGDTWIHVVGHDKHQSAQYIGRRGARRSPVPPSQTENNSGEPEENSGEPESRPPDAVLHGTLDNSGSLTSTSTSISTSTASKLASSEPAPELVRTVELLSDAFPSVQSGPLLLQLSEHAAMSSSPEPRFYLEAAIEIVGKKGSVRFSSGMFNLVVRKAQTKERNLGIDEAQARKAGVSAVPVAHVVSELPPEIVAELEAMHGGAA